MRITKTESFSTNSLVKLKNQDWLNKQHIAGKIAAHTLTWLKTEVENKTSKSLLELNEAAENLIIDAGGIPTFKNYKGFPSGVCMSLNKQLVHGIPSNSHLNDGDIITFDLGVTFEGAIADTAITCIYGTPKSDKHLSLVNAVEECLLKAIESIAIGKKLGCIGNAIYKCARNYGFSVINNYGGHGLEWDQPHAAPFVQNKSDGNDGIHIQPGLTIAIEPLLCIGSSTTKILSDGWTVVTDDISAHVEHSLFIHNDCVEVITWRGNEKFITKPKYYF